MQFVRQRLTITLRPFSSAGCGRGSFLGGGILGVWPEQLLGVGAAVPANSSGRF